VLRCVMTVEHGIRSHRTCHMQVLDGNVGVLRQQ
jgi:hypothetical protein